MSKFLKIFDTSQMVKDVIFFNIYNFRDIQIFAVFHKFQVILYIPNNKLLKYIFILTISVIIKILLHTTIS
jgi:hypothetical protein